MKRLKSMATDAKPNLTLKVRFPEFVGQTTHEVLLQEVTAECKIQNPGQLSAESIMGVTKTDGLVPTDERLIGSDISRYKLLKKNWFAYNPMRLDIGSIARWKNNRDALVSPDYIVFRCRDEPSAAIDPEFLDHFRRSEQWEDFVSESGLGSVRVRIYYKDIARLRLNLPQISEQRKIAECLSALEGLIEAESRKLDALSIHKRGLMQQVFPCEGETLPHLRLPEFQNAPKWSEMKLGDIVDIRSGNSPSQYRLSTKGRNAFVKVDDLNNCTKYQVEARERSDDTNGIIPRGSVIFPKRGAAIDLNKIRLNVFPLLLDTNVMALTPGHQCTPEFLYYYLSSVGLSQIADSSTIPQINNKHIIPFKIALPETAEQERIATSLSSLDELIAAQSDKFETLKSHRKGLMQQIFPPPPEVRT